jgi:DNA-directed RNA polymerase II subunit RPB1
LTVKKLRMEEIATRISDYFGGGVHVIYTDDNSTTGLVIRVRIMVSEEDRQGETEEVASGSGDYEILRRMQKTLLEKLYLRGVAGIKKVYMSKKTVSRWSENDGFVPRQEWMLETDGTNFAEVMTIPSVDHTNTWSNDILEMFRVLGIEGARSSLFNELRGVLSFDGAYVNYRHIACLADCMTFGGYLMAVSRHGINRGESGPMLRASFEETVEVFMNAAVYSQYDLLNGVTENVMLGQLGKLGTGMVDLLIDANKLQNAVDTYEMDRDEEHDGFKKSAMDHATPAHTPFGQATPSFGGFDSMTPFAAGAFTPAGMASPFAGGAASPRSRLGYSPGYASPGYASPGYASPGYAAKSATPGYVAMSPARSHSSPAYGASPGYVGSMNSPAYSPTSPVYSPTSPAYSPTRYKLVTIIRILLLKLSS